MTSPSGAFQPSAFPCLSFRFLSFRFLLARSCFAFDAANVGGGRRVFMSLLQQRGGEAQRLRDCAGVARRDGESNSPRYKTNGMMQPYPFCQDTSRHVDKYHNRTNRVLFPVLETPPRGKECPRRSTEPGCVELSDHCPLHLCRRHKLTLYPAD